MRRNRALRHEQVDRQPVIHPLAAPAGGGRTRVDVDAVARVAATSRVQSPSGGVCPGAHECSDSPLRFTKRHAPSSSARRRGRLRAPRGGGSGTARRGSTASSRRRRPSAGCGGRPRSACACSRGRRSPGRASSARDAAPAECCASCGRRRAARRRRPRGSRPRSRRRRGVARSRPGSRDRRRARSGPLSRACSVGIDVHDDLVPIAAVQRLGAVLEEALGQHDERVGTAARQYVGLSSKKVADCRDSDVSAETCSAIFTIIRQRQIAQRRLERLEQQRAGLGGQLHLDHERAVVVVGVREPAVRLLPRLARQLLDFLHAAELAHERLDVMRGAVQRDIEQHVSRSPGSRRGSARAPSSSSARRGPSRRRSSAAPRAHGPRAPSRAPRRYRGRTSS